MNYYELREIVSRIVPRNMILKSSDAKVDAIREKGRKVNYRQYDLLSGQMNQQQRLLNTKEINSFAEISLRAQACPMPFNLDVWDGLLCGYACRYCYADSFRASLYTSFFDNSRSIGMRHCNPDSYKIELDKLLKNRHRKPEGSDLQRAVSIGIPMRFGIRFEDFLPIEGKKKISLELLRYLAKVAYPVMINTKSDLLGREDYLRALSDNPAGAAVHVTLISSDDVLLKKIEPGAPRYQQRLNAMKAMATAGIRVVARIEPYMVFINDDREAVARYIEQVWDAGVRHITFDTYSYSANNPGIRASFIRQGYDFQRMFLLTSDSQAIGSLLLGEFMKLFRAKGFSCSTFDLGNVPANDDGACCCEVGNYFKGPHGFNYGSAVSAIRYIQDNSPDCVSWNDFETYVETHGGFLSDRLRTSVQRLWNSDGPANFFISWAQGILPCGSDDNGAIWKYNPKDDFRQSLLKGVL